MRIVVENAMVHLDNPCEACVKTDNHCCVTDLHLSFGEAVVMMRYAKDLGKNVVLGPHPESNCQMVLMMVPNKPGMNVRREPCVFFGSDGKCEIYEDRPSICRAYGTQDMKCRFQNVGMWKEKDIANCSMDDIKALDELAMDKDFPVLGKMVKFEKS